MRAQSDRFLLLSPALSPSPVPSLTQWPIHGPQRESEVGNLPLPDKNHRREGGRGFIPPFRTPLRQLRMAKRSIEMTYRILVSVVKYNCDLRIHPRCVKKMYLFFAIHKCMYVFAQRSPLLDPHLPTRSRSRDNRASVLLPLFQANPFSAQNSARCDGWRRNNENESQLGSGENIA